MGPPPFTLPLEKRPKCTEETGYCCVRNHPTLKLGIVFILLTDLSRTHQGQLTSLGNSTGLFLQDGGITQLVSLQAASQEL